MALTLAHWQDVPLTCDRANPGVGHHNPRVMDLSQRATTADQQRIEAALDPLVQSRREDLACRRRQLVTGVALARAWHRDHGADR